MTSRVTRVQIVVEGLQYSTDFSRAAARPIILAQPSQLVYSPHDYEWSQPVVSYDQVHQLEPLLLNNRTLNP